MIWSPPALLIIIMSGVVFYGGVGYGLLHALFGVEEKLALGIGLLLASLCAILMDVAHRSSEQMTAFDRSQSTLMFVVPTWLAGVLCTLGSCVEIIDAVSKPGDDLGLHDVGAQVVCSNVAAAPADRGSRSPI
jgi:hypothetical protein